MGRHVNAAYTACAMDWGRNRILRVGKNPGHIIRRLWTKFTKFWDDVGDPSYFSTRLPGCLCLFRSEDIHH